MALYGGVEDGHKIRLPNSPARLCVDVANVTFTGTGSIKFPEMDSVAFVSLEQVIGSSPGVGAQNFTYTVSGNTVSLFAWMPTSSANPTLIAATGAATVTVVAFGYRRQSQSV